MSNQEKSNSKEVRNNFDNLEGDMLTRKNIDQTKGGLNKVRAEKETLSSEKGTSTTEIG